MPQLYDIFLFNNEFDVLEIRLHELSPIVDRFVICESPVTFSGKEKPLHFSENRERFASFADRIDHVVIKDVPLAAPDEQNLSKRRRERRTFGRQCTQRNRLAGALLGLADDDLVLLSDVDEIPRATALKTACETIGTGGEVHCFELRMFKYYLNLEHPDFWLRSGPRLVRRRHLTNLQSLRDVCGPSPSPLRNAARFIRASVAMRRPVRRIVHRNSGWHFGTLNGPDAVVEKYQSNSHVVDERLLNRDYVSQRIGDAVTGRVDQPVKLVRCEVDETFPAYVREHANRFCDLIRPDG